MIADLIEDTFKLAEKNNISIILHPEDTIEYVDGESRVSGYFVADDGPKKPTLGVAIGKHTIDWLPVFIHESCHMDQFLEKDPVFMNLVVKGVDASEHIYKYANGCRKPDVSIGWATKRTIDAEYNCERRVVDKILKYNIEDFIDVEQYTQQSIAYIWSYTMIKEQGKWYETSPHDHYEIWSQMPKSFQNFDPYKIPRKLKSLMKKECFDSA